MWPGSAGRGAAGQAKEFLTQTRDGDTMTYYEAMQSLAEMLPQESDDPRLWAIANEMWAAKADLAMLRGTVGAQETAIRNLREDLRLETALAVSWRKRFDEASSILRFFVGMEDWGDLDDPEFSQQRKSAFDRARAFIARVEGGKEGA